MLYLLYHRPLYCHKYQPRLCHTPPPSPTDPSWVVTCLNLYRGQSVSSLTNREGFLYMLKIYRQMYTCTPYMNIVHVRTFDTCPLPVNIHVHKILFPCSFVGTGMMLLPLTPASWAVCSLRNNNLTAEARASLRRANPSISLFL